MSAPRSRPRALGRIALLALLLCPAPVLSGCATLGVEAWDRDQLARPEMKLGANATEDAIDDHIYFSKEASMPGGSGGGGGCGCN